MDVPVALRSWVCDTGLETGNDVLGGWTALLGPGLGLTPVEALAMSTYLARIAWRLARRAARISSTGGGELGRSSSISATLGGCSRASGGLEGRSSFVDGDGDCVR
jgi:hypothetical protein